MKRYMVVSHARIDEKLRIESGKILNHQPVHNHMQCYHWVRLDEDHILLLGDYSLSQHEALQAHDKVSLLPHISSSKKVHSHLKHEAHKQALDTLGITTDHTMEDLIERAVAVHGPSFLPDK